MSMFIKGLILFTSLYVMIFIYYRFEKLKRAHRWFSKRKVPVVDFTGMLPKVPVIYHGLLASIVQSLDGNAGAIVKLYLQQGVVYHGFTMPIHTDFKSMEVAQALYLFNRNFLQAYGHTKVGDNAITETEMFAMVSDGDPGGHSMFLPNLTNIHEMENLIYNSGVLDKHPLFFIHVSFVIATSDTNPYYTKHFIKNQEKINGRS